NHSLHEEILGFNDSCAKCHDLSKPKSRENSKPCFECHREDMQMEKPKTGIFNDKAAGYMNAMHGSCIPCHKEQGLKNKKPELGECSACHLQIKTESKK
ncbi:MAG: cytochrome c3 family protein, partial [bacterium]